MPTFLVCFIAFAAPGPSSQSADAIEGLLSAFDSAWVVAIGENHGHVELHDLILSLLEDPRTPHVIDDIAVEWGNSLYQSVIDRFIAGDGVPWDSVTMAWRNTVVSPNTVWDAPVYERFFREVRRINQSLPQATRYRVLLTDSPVDWSAVHSVSDLQPFFDRARFMADVIRTKSLGRGRRSLFLAGGLHVAKRPRVRLNQAGVPIGEVTPVAWLELHHPGATFVVQSMGAASRLRLPELIGQDAPQYVPLTEGKTLSSIAAHRTTTLRNRDGSTPDVYGTATFADIVDAVILWSEADLTFADPDADTYQVDWYWDALNRRSTMLRGRPMNPSLRSGNDL